MVLGRRLPPGLLNTSLIAFARVSGGLVLSAAAAKASNCAAEKNVNALAVASLANWIVSAPLVFAAVMTATGTKLPVVVANALTELAVVAVCVPNATLLAAVAPRVIVFAPVPTVIVTVEPANAAVSVTELGPLPSVMLSVSPETVAPPWTMETLLLSVPPATVAPLVPTVEAATGMFPVRVSDVRAASTRYQPLPLTTHCSSGSG